MKEHIRTKGWTKLKERRKNRIENDKKERGEGEGKKD